MAAGNRIGPHGFNETARPDACPGRPDSRREAPVKPREWIAGWITWMAVAVTNTAGGDPTTVVTLGQVKADRARREITVSAQVCLRKGNLEFLLCRWGAKTHESIFHTRAMAADLHAALLALGLSPGTPAEWRSDEEGRGRFLPPRGARLTIHAAWRNKQGARTRIDVSRLVAVRGAGKTAPPKQWVFVGSDVLGGGRYWADLEGGMISVANLASAVIDVPFESPRGLDERTFLANTETIPQVGTVVDLIIRPLPGAEKARHARATLEIDATGGFRLDGRAAGAGGLQRQAEAFIARHALGTVVIRAHPRALAADIAMVRGQLQMAGVRRIDHQWSDLAEAVLPRTAGQLSRAMKDWARRLANPAEYLENSSVSARRTLDRIRRELSDLKGRRELLSRYAEELHKAMARRKPRTQPGRKVLHE